MNANKDICDMKEDIKNTVTRVIDEVVVQSTYYWTRLDIFNN